MSNYRNILENYLKTLDINADRVVDVGGGALPVKGRVRSWDVGECLVFDNKLEEPRVKIDYLLDLNEKLFNTESLSYIAGIVDGEGCVSVSRSNKGNGNCFSPSFGMNMRESGAFEIIKKTFGFDYSYRKKSDGKDYYGLQLTGKKLRLFLTYIYPYLVIKKEQAKMALALRQNLDEIKPKIIYRGGSELPQEVIDHRNEIYERVKLLNHYKDRFNTVFCLEISEYWSNPVSAIQTLSWFLKQSGDLYITFPFLYPIHEPKKADYLRYTADGIARLLGENGFKILEMIPRIMTPKGFEYWKKFIQAEGMHSSKHSRHDILGWIIKARKG